LVFCSGYHVQAHAVLQEMPRPMDNYNREKRIRVSDSVRGSNLKEYGILSATRLKSSRNNISPRIYTEKEGFMDIAFVSVLNGRFRIPTSAMFVF